MNTYDAKQNPYAAPSTMKEPAGSGSPDEATRQEHLSHEASIKSFGLLYFAGSVIMVIGGMSGIVTSIGQGSVGPLLAALGVLYIVLGAIQFWIGTGLRSLNKVGRIGGTVLGSLGLLAIPIGTLICGYLLYLLWSEKGNVVFSEDYKRVIQATPHIQYKTSVAVWILLGLLLLFALFGIIALIVGG